MGQTTTTTTTTGICPVLLANTNEGVVLFAPLELDDDTKDKMIMAKQTRRLLYVAYVSAQFSQVSWDFCSVFFLSAFCNDESFLLVSTYGMTSGLAVFLLGGKVGRFLDLSNRLYATRKLIWYKHVCTVLTVLFCFCLLCKKGVMTTTTTTVDDDEGGATTTTTTHNNNSYGSELDPITLLLTAIHLLASMAEVLFLSFIVAIERDWIVVMSRFVQDNQNIMASSAWLSESIVRLRQVDLCCRVLSPALIGMVLGAMGSLKGAAVLVGACNILALVVEDMCCTQIYSTIPDLAERKMDESVITMQQQVQNKDDNNPPSKQSSAAPFFSFQLPLGLRIYMNQSVCVAGIAYSLLWLNVLTFGTIMTAYLIWRGMSVDAVGIWRGISALIGLVGTCAYHMSVKRGTTIMDTGMGSILTQFLCLSLSFLSLFVVDDWTALTMLIVGVCASRVGLYAFDVAVTQLFQEHTPDEVRSVVGGVQQSLGSFFGILSYAIGLFFPDPNDFFIYAAIGYFSVGLAMALYAWMVYFRRGYIEMNTTTSSSMSTSCVVEEEHDDLTNNNNVDNVQSGKHIHPL